VILAVGEQKVRVRFRTGASAVVLGRTDPVQEQYPDVDLTPLGGAELGVSRLHARLSYEAGRFYLEDLHSTNHTYIGEAELAPREPRALSSGQVIRLGRLEMLFLPES
jgi:pSer/pThr/pTyr-binding forkhead associated (FHA) protein